MVFGSRNLDDYDLVSRHLDRLTVGFDYASLTIVTGEWRGVGYGTPNYVGADLLAEQWAARNKVGTKRFPPPFEDFAGGWKKKHPGAFHKRNRDMVKFIASQGKKGYGLGFHDGESPGTASVIELCRQYEVYRLKVITY